MRTGFEVDSGPRPLADPRRRYGGHGQARQLLTDDRRSLEPVNHTWRGLVAALQRHTLEAAMAALHEEERLVLSLAYLEGRTNREIAAMLSVSVSTVSRRLAHGLAQIEQQLSRAGAVVSAVILLALAYFARRLADARATKLLAPGASHSAIVLTAASAAGAVAIGLLVINEQPAVQHRVPPPAVNAVTAVGPAADSMAPSATPNQPLAVENATPGKRADGESTSAATATQIPQSGDNGCGGNPTDAAPGTPVGRHTGGAPVTHPTAGGCGPHA